MMKRHANELTAQTRPQTESKPRTPYAPLLRWFSSVRVKRSRVLASKSILQHRELRAVLVDADICATHAPRACECGPAVQDAVIVNDYNAASANLCVGNFG